MARILSGQVVSAKMTKTVVVAVTRVKKHPLYGKKYRVTKKYLAHDASDQLTAGQLVQISETRPLSKRKRWQVVTEKQS